jgi:hypothetical protein
MKVAIDAKALSKNGGTVIPPFLFLHRGMIAI